MDTKRTAVVDSITYLHALALHQGSRPPRVNLYFFGPGGPAGARASGLSERSAAAPGGGSPKKVWPDVLSLLAIQEPPRISTCSASSALSETISSIALHQLSRPPRVNLSFFGLGGPAGAPADGHINGLHREPSGSAARSSGVSSTRARASSLEATFTRHFYIRLGPLFACIDRARRVLQSIRRINFRCRARSGVNVA